MKKQTEGLHHFHTRKRVHQKHEPYPHPHKFKNFIDKVIYPVGILGPVMTIPQLAKIWINQDATGVSAISWSAYLVLAIFWLLYGVIHKEWPIILSSVLWILMDAMVVLGIFYYG